jgi:hypothetical protein
MKRIIILISLLFLYQTCTWRDSESEGHMLKCDCSRGYPVIDPVYCSGQLCQGDTCQTYFTIWKEIFLEKNQMTSEYFDLHITICSTGIYQWNDGISFNTYYKVKIGWVEYRFYDQFPIYITTTDYPGLNVPRNALLTKEQIKTVLDTFFFSSQIGRINPVNDLKYATKEEAMKALNLATGVDTFCVGSVYFPQRANDTYTVGHPYIQANGILNWDENRCIYGSIDLLTGDTYSNESVCFISFCFAGGTQISLPGVPAKPIDRTRTGDRILSLNLNTMKVEEDIVQKVDSVLHDDMISVVFSDKTVNLNTADHPYLVKGKGWCSFKPAETISKYRIKTKQLQPGDMCYKFKDGKLAEVTVKSITPMPGSVMTYNITGLKKNKVYFANGIAVSNEGE